MTALVNLIPASRLRARRNAAAVRAWAGVNCMGVLLLVGTWGVMTGIRDPATDTLQAQLDQAETSIRDAQTEVKRASTELAGLTRQLSAAPDVRERPEWGVLLSTLGAVRGGAIALVALDLSPLASAAAAKAPVAARAGLPSHYQLRLSGLAQDHRSATGFSLAVERTGLFSQVRLTDATTQSVGGVVVVAFSIECVLDDVGGEP